MHRDRPTGRPAEKRGVGERTPVDCGREIFGEGGAARALTRMRARLALAVTAQGRRGARLAFAAALDTHKVQKPLDAPLVLQWRRVMAWRGPAAPRALAASTTAKKTTP